jgi:hypothetical protein
MMEVRGNGLYLGLYYSVSLEKCVCFFWIELGAEKDDCFDKAVEFVLFGLISSVDYVICLKFLN